MLTTTEIILLVTVWSLTCIGLFFGVRAKLRRRGKKKLPPDSDRKKNQV